MNDDQMRVLKMIEDGKFSPEKGADLLEAVRKRKPESSTEAPGRRARWLKVRVFEGDMQKAKVNVRLPLGLARLALKFIPRAALKEMEEEGIDVHDIEELVADLAGTGPFRIVDVQDDDTKVEVFLE